MHFCTQITGKVAEAPHKRIVPLAKQVYLLGDLAELT